MRPDIRKFEDYRLFLREYIQWMGSDNRKYSLRWVAERAGFSSPSMLSMVISGQRALPRDKVAGLTTALKLLSDEADCFRLVFEMQQTDDPKERSRLEKQMIQDHRGGLFQDPSEDGYEVFKKWYLPAIRELVALKHFRCDPFWIAGQLGITPFEARDGLALLLEAGLVRDDKGVFSRSVPSVQPRGPMPKGLIDEFNRQYASRGSEAISLPRDQRYFNALTIAVSKAAFAKIPEILSRLIAEVDMLAEADPNRDDVAVLNVQFYSLTAKQVASTDITKSEHRESFANE